MARLTEAQLRHQLGNALSSTMAALRLLKMSEDTCKHCEELIDKVNAELPPPATQRG